ncbi:MAG: hypothetical protein RLP02_20520, partial [Coleofasciculus sp. C2-GNP5-27]
FCWVLGVLGCWAGYAGEGGYGGLGGEAGEAGEEDYQSTINNQQLTNNLNRYFLNISQIGE